MKYPAIMQYLHENNISIRKFAEQCGVADSTMWKTLKGINDPSKYTIDSILEVTGMTYEKCFNEHPEKTGRISHGKTK